MLAPFILHASIGDTGVEGGRVKTEKKAPLWCLLLFYRRRQTSDKSEF